MAASQFPCSLPHESDYNDTNVKAAREEAIMEDSPQNHEQVAGNGLLHRRMFLAGSAAAAVGAGAVPSGVSAAPLPVEPWMQTPGAGFNGYGQPSKYEE